MPHKLPIIDNFASLFTLIANHEGATKQVSKEMIVGLLKSYVTASLIDINESLLEFDFDVKLAPVYKNRETPDIRTKIKETQLIVDTRSGKSLKLISPDCIFIPI